MLGTPAEGVDSGLDDQWRRLRLTMSRALGKPPEARCYPEPSRMRGADSGTCPRPESRSRPPRDYESPGGVRISYQ